VTRSHSVFLRARYWLPVLLLPLVLLMAACSGETETATSVAPAPSTTAGAPGTANMPELDIPGLPEVPPEARVGDGGPAPRPASYWAQWNTCAPDNRAEVAESNGGRAAGFILIDDLLLDPGIGLGDHVLTDCEEALAVLEAGEDAPEDSLERLAHHLLVAELNLLVNSESCPAAEEAAVGGHYVLSQAGYAGPEAPGSLPAGESADALVSFVALLSAYNGGDLCY
jgi:hypothetical protein